MRATRLGCAGDGSGHERSFGDYDYDVWSCCPSPALDGRGRANLHLERLEERSDRSLPIATFLDLNGYLPIGIPMLKPVLALQGQMVCRKGLTIFVDGIDMGNALSRESRGRPLPVW